MNRARLLAYRSLLSSTKNGKYTNLELGSVLEKETLSPADKTLFTKLYLGVTEKKITLDYLLSRISTIPLNTLSPEVLCLLELGAFQILYLDRIPHRAAVFETVELAKKEAPQAASYCNALFRRLSAEKDSIFSLLEIPGKKGLALRYGYPKWLVSLWQEAYGKEKCEDILKAQNHPAPLTLRVNTLKISAQDYARLLTEHGFAFHKNRLCQNGFTLEKNMSPTLLPGYEEGLFFIQDAAAQHAIDLLGAKKGERILDLCAAPGGKSYGAAMDMAGVGEILSAELHDSRLSLIREGARRLGITMITAVANDSSLPKEEWNEAFDRVICDVPCSGFGVIAKKPDIRHKDKGEAETLPPIQLAILETGANALKKGGRLLYSTCTLNPDENERVTDAFLEKHHDFSRIGKAETIFPVGGENDGFFCDILEKQYDGKN